MSTQLCAVLQLLQYYDQNWCIWRIVQGYLLTIAIIMLFKFFIIFKDKIRIKIKQIQIAQLHTKKIQIKTKQFLWFNVVY